MLSACVLIYIVVNSDSYSELGVNQPERTDIAKIILYFLRVKSKLLHYLLHVNNRSKLAK